MKNQSVRKFVKTEALNGFDGDYNILYRNVKNKLLEGTTIESKLRSIESTSGTPVLTDIEALAGDLPLLNISVPVNIEKWNTDSYTPLVAVQPVTYDEKTATKVKAYDSEGNIHWLDAKKEPDMPVIVIGLSERMVVSPTGQVEFKKGFGPLPEKQIEREGPPLEEPCDCPTPIEPTPPTVNYWERKNQSREFLTAVNCTDIGQYEGWVAGAPEIRVKVYTAVFGGGNLFEAANFIIEPDKRDDVDNKWWNCNAMLHFWDVEYNGYNAIYYFDEEDEDINIGSFLKCIANIFKGLAPKSGFSPGPIPGGVLTPNDLTEWAEIAESLASIDFAVKNNTEHIGTLQINFKECRNEYALGTTFKFKSTTP